jgi:DNA invertase Pin-like site-specific DNA recombinase
MTERRVIELVRVSSDGQHDRGTPDAQRHALDRLREQRPGRIIARIDPPHGVSGALPVDQRPDLIELRALIAAHGLDELRVYDLDRLSRAESPLDRLAVLAICADAGAIIVDASGRELDPQTDAGELTYYLSTLFARQERRRLLERTKAGRQRRAREGRFAGGTLPYGLRASEDTILVDDAAAAVVRRVFAMCASSTTCAEIARALNAEGVPSAKGVRWTARRVIDLIRRRAYVGELEQHQGGETYTLAIPPMVDAETWRSANEAIDGRRAWSGRPRAHSTGLVQGLVRCGVCGQGVHVSQGSSRGRRTYYTCRSSHQSYRYGPPCGLGHHRVEAVDAVVWAELVALVTDPAVLAGAIAPESSSSQWTAQLERCERELARLSDLEADWLRLSRRGLLSVEALERHLAGVAADRTTLRRTAEVAREAVESEAHAVQLAADVAAILPELAERMRDAPHEQRRAFVDVLVPRRVGFGITLHRNGRADIVGAVPIPTAAPKVSAAACSRADFGGDESARILPFRRAAR